MDKENVYILQKDLPDGSKAGDEYQYYAGTDLVYKNIHTSGRMKVPHFAVENNPIWFKLKEEENPTVVSMQHGNDNIHYHLSNEKVVTISKERLAEILIAEKEGRYCIDDKFMWYREDNEIIKDKKYSEREYLEFGQKCFEAARKNNSEWYFKYKDFSSYMNSKSEDK